MRSADKKFDVWTVANSLWRVTWMVLMMFVMIMMRSRSRKRDEKEKSIFCVSDFRHDLKPHCACSAAIICEKCLLLLSNMTNITRIPRTFTVLMLPLFTRISARACVMKKTFTWPSNGIDDILWTNQIAGDSFQPMKMIGHMNVTVNTPCNSVSFSWSKETCCLLKYFSFLPQDAQDHQLEESRDRLLTKRAILIQKVVRGFLTKKRFVKQKQGAVVIQKVWRGHHQRARYLKVSYRSMGYLWTLPPQECQKHLKLISGFVSDS